MRDFQDFIDSIDPDDYRTIIISAKGKMNSSTKREACDESFIIALELLHRYHIWNNESAD